MYGVFRIEEGQLDTRVSVWDNEASAVRSARVRQADHNRLAQRMNIRPATFVVREV